ncbi:MAG: PQQ-binding-like beta-propeller repeat protein [Halioglobus sp.]|nr:PQQ-binding-like beta-propeller repeat protein [Halioglobus sp.]
MIRTSVVTPISAVFAICVLLGLGPVGCEQNDDSRLARFEKRSDALPDEEWRSYLGDKRFSHFSALSQIDTSNVSRLQEVWRYDAGGASQNGATQMQCSAIVVEGILYCTSPLLHLFALNAATGEELWHFEPSSDFGLLPNPNRGVAYWEEEFDDDTAALAEPPRILFTAGSFLYAINARTGKPIVSFGDDGKVDLHAGLSERFSGEAINATTPGSVYKNLLIIGSRVNEFKGAAPGHIRAFDVLSGDLRWVFHTIPQQGEYGADSWPAASSDTAGGANSWAGIAVDEQRGLAFVPTGSPSFDFYGDDRHGDNLFANSLIALNAGTGERVWHYQFIRHDLWDRDLPSPPNLVTIERDGTAIPAVAQATKTGHLFVFHRETGEPLFPLNEIPVVGEGVSGERPAVSQPLPLEPPPFAEQEFVITDRNPAMTKAVQQRVKGLDQGNAFIAPSTRGMVLYPGMDGGAEWGGAAYDEIEQRLYINSNEVPYLLQLTPVSKDLGLGPQLGYLSLCAGCHGADLRGDGVSVPGLLQLSDRLSPLEAYNVVAHGRGRMPAFAQIPWYAKAAIVWYVYTADEEQELSGQHSGAAQGEVAYLNAGFQKLTDPEGLPASKPPWGTLTAIDLKQADILWRIPLGDYPEVLAQGHSGYGSENYGGPIVTAGDLLFIAATPDQMIKAYNKHTGKVLWQARLPAAGFATPITYAVDGRQYLVVAAGGGKLGQSSGSSYVAFALPD